LSVRVTPGEYEPVSFAVRTEETTSLTVSYVTGGDSLALPESWVKIQRVDRRTDTTTVRWLYDLESAVEVQAQKTAFFWITLHPPVDAAPGFYSGTVELQSGTGSKVLALQCEILPFILEETSIKLATYPYRTDLPQKVFLDMKEHGLDGIWLPWGNVGPIKVTNVEDKLALDFSILDSTMQKFQASGMKGPVQLQLGSSCLTLYENSLASAFGLPIDEYHADMVVNGEIWVSEEIRAAEISPELDSLFVEGLRQIYDHWNANYPEIELTMMIYDEQAQFFLERHRNRYNLLKTVMPYIRVDGTCMDFVMFAEQLKDQCDIFVQHGDILATLKLARETGKDVWIAGYPTLRDARTGQVSLTAVHASRNLMGLMAWAAEAEVAWFWAFNWWGLPDQDSHIMIYPYPEPDDSLWYVWDGSRRVPLDALEFMSSTPWEAVREGWDDLRYLATAEKVISEAGAVKKAWAEYKLSAIFDEMRSLSCFVEGGTLWKQPLCALPSSRMHEIRQELIEIITTEVTQIPGDVSQDTKVDIFDLLELLKVLSGRVESSFASDVDMNGRTDIFDLLAMLKMLAG
ncbi:MAG TPA: dockerin type I domain-containing protein, partial [Acidobacteriota bacterium]|nr:dockerin type I domain-containing protein [Acidobacteriota bacterium]